MQVERSGDDWTLSYSNDGLTWTEAVTFIHTMAVSALGPFVGNDGDSGTAPAHTAMIDYFFNALDPIEPEDGGTVPTECTLDVTVTGSGTVGVDPDQTTYGCGELVTLTAIPDAGYEFTDWSGDLSGSENPATIAMNFDKSVTASFILDTTPPVIENIKENAGRISATITWTTDEPATSVVEYGETTSYELGMVEDVNLKLSHFIGLTGLIPGVEYHYRITSEDASGFSSTTVDRTFSTDDGSSGAPLIQVWYGSEQTFGSLGNPQRWVNVLGNVSDPDGVSVLKYSLNPQSENGESEVPLTIGPGYYRLANTGDFNVEIALTDLRDGVNHVIVTAEDSLGNETAEVVVLNYASGNVWPESYTIDWSNASSIQDVAQVVDGLWQIEDGNVRVVEPGYDRIIAIGDIAWTNYEVIVPVTVHGPIPYPPTIPNPAALGLLVRWQGHVEDGYQPSMQWWPLGVFAYYRFVDTSPYLRLWAQQNSSIGLDFNLQFEIDVKYIFKLRSETVSGDSTYSFKVWRADESEPSDWNLVGQEPADDQTQGSLILVAHHVDASFGNVSITPLFQEQYVLAVNAAGNGIVEKSPDQPTYTFGETITLTATADPGWVFTGWSGDLSGTDNPASIVMFEDRNISANFSEIIQHTLNVTTDGNGTVTVEPDLPLYDLGQQVTLTATPDPDWVFTGWSGDLSGTDNPASIVMF
ncbi:MAG: InlB B-repeat-containing protein, partial [Desulfobacteria bacterium]